MAPIQNLSKNNYTLGRGELYFSRFADPDEKTLPEGGGFRFLGNAPTFTLTSNSTTLEHYRSTSGVKVKDLTVILQVDYTSSLVLEDISIPNLAINFLGSESDYTRAAASAVKETIHGAKPGLRYFVGIDDTNPGGLKNITNVVAAVGVNALTGGIDYIFDGESGGIEFLVGGKVTSLGADVDITYDILATTATRAISGSDQIEGAIKYVPHNAVGKNVDYIMPYCTLTPSGDFSLIADTLQQITLKVGVQALGNRGAIYAGAEKIV